MVGDRPSKTLARGLDVLELVLHASKPMRLKDVADKMGMDMASAYRALRTLELSGYLIRGKAKHGYRPGQKIWSLSRCLPDLKDAFDKLSPVLRALSEQSGQVAHVGMLDGGRVVLTDVALTRSARISVAQNAGDTEDVYCSAIGKTLVAFAPSTLKTRVIKEQSFTRHTEFTILDKSALELELTEIRRKKVAFDDREGSLDVSCIAAPICDPSGRAAIAIGISTVASKLTGTIHERTDWIESVTASAAQAERLIWNSDS